MPAKTRNCAAFGCGTKSTRGGAEPMFKFPKLEDRFQRLKVWVQRAGNAELLNMGPKAIHETRYLCRRHFEPCMFTNRCQVQLLRSAVPSRFVQPPLPEVVMHQFLSQEGTSTNAGASTSSTTLEISMDVEMDAPDRGKAVKRPLLVTLPDDPPESKISRQEADISQNCTVTSTRRNINRTPQGSSVRSRSPKRVSLKMMAGVKNVKTARPEVIQIARTAQEYRGIALDIKRKLVVAQRRNGSLKRLASKNFVDRVDEMLISKGGRRILQGELRNFKRRPRGRRWTLDEKLFALAIYKRSPRVYRFLCKHITLPCESTLKQILQKIPLQPGISGPMMKLLKNSVKKMKDKDKHCVLLFDEIFLVSNVFLNQLTGEVDGFENYGEHGRTNLIADHALVFMAQGLNKKWTQPVAYYFVHKTCPSTMLKKLIIDVVRALREAGLNILATVSDQGPTNRGAVSDLKESSTKDDIIYEIDGKRMVHIWDVPHIFKNVRNNLISSDLEYDRGAVAEWRHLIEFFKLDESLCKLSPLTYKHLNPAGKVKMRVKYAVQLLSCKTGNGIENNIHLSDGKYLPDCLVTADFCRLADEFFDLTNGPSSNEKPEQKKPWRTSVKKNSIHHDKYNKGEGWPKMIKSLEKWTYIRKSTGERHIPPCIKGWIQSVKGMQWLWLRLNENGIYHLNLRHLNQDAIENLFCKIRQCCGSGTDLTTVQFTGALKTCLLTNFSGNVRDKNCEDDDGFMLDDMRSLIGDEIEAACQQDTEQTLVRGCQPIPEALGEKLHQVNRKAPSFICSTILNDVKWECSECLALLTSEKNSELTFTLTSSHYSLKSYIKHHPSPLLTSAFITVMQVFEDKWSTLLHKRDALERLLNCFEAAVDVSSFNCLHHQGKFRDQFLGKTVRYLVERKCKKINMNRKKGIFKRTRQVLYHPKDIDGLRNEDEEHQLSFDDEALLNGSRDFLRPQKVPRRHAPTSSITLASQGFMTPQPHCIPLGAQTPTGMLKQSKSMVQTPMATPHLSMSTPLLHTPTTSTMAAQPQHSAARAKILEAWSHVPCSPAPVTATPRVKPSKPAFEDLVKENKVHMLNIKELKEKLKGKTKISGLNKAQLVNEVYRLFK